MLRRPLPLACLGLSLLAALPASAVAQTETAERNCLEVISTGSGTGSGSAVLLDKCTSRTYVLTRVERPRGEATYEWVPVPMRQDRPARKGSKCFSYDGREFCP